MKQKFPGFKKCMAMMRDPDRATRENGFDTLLSQADEHIPELIEEFNTEPVVGLRCWLLELIAATESSDMLEFFGEQLRAADPRIRRGAIRGLQILGTTEARKLLYEARSYEFDSPEETEAFRADLQP